MIWICGALVITMVEDDILYGPSEVEIISDFVPFEIVMS